MLENSYPGIAGSEECQKWVTGSICEIRSILVPSDFLADLRTDGAGVDTTQAILRRFVYAMVANPQIQKRAQEELDGITEGGRLPTLEE
jgi:hypothetical protein